MIILNLGGGLDIRFHWSSDTFSSNLGLSGSYCEERSDLRSLPSVDTLAGELWLSDPNHRFLLPVCHLVLRPRCVADYEDSILLEIFDRPAKPTSTLRKRLARCKLP